MWSAAGDGTGESFQLLKMVNIQKTMENSRFLWPCSSSQTVSHYQAGDNNKNAWYFQSRYMENDAWMMIDRSMGIWWGSDEPRNLVDFVGKMIYFNLKPHLVGGFKPWMDYFPFHIWDVIRNPLTHIFQDCFLTTNQSPILHHKAHEWENTVDFLLSHSRKKRSPLAQSMSSQLVLGQVIWYGAGYFFSVCTVYHK